MNRIQDWRTILSWKAQKCVGRNTKSCLEEDGGIYICRILRLVLEVNEKIKALLALTAGAVAGLSLWDF